MLGDPHNWHKLQFHISIAELLEPGQWYMHPLESFPAFEHAAKEQANKFLDLLGESAHIVRLPKFIKVSEKGCAAADGTLNPGISRLVFGTFDDEPVLTFASGGTRYFYRVPDEYEGTIQSFCFVCTACERDWYYANCTDFEVNLGGGWSCKYYPADHMMFGAASDNKDYPLAKFRNGRCPHCDGQLMFQFGQ